ncbi:MAG: cyclic nucleotide-binding domain-containing protein, partial [Terriglobia bacterium]
EVKTGDLGKEYEDGEVICEQGEQGNCMYVIQGGQVAIEHTDGDQKATLATLGKRDFFGEMAVFEKEPRSATARAVGRARVLPVDKRTLLRRVQEDPSFAFRLIQEMSGRIRNLNQKVTQLEDTE